MEFPRVLPPLERRGRRGVAEASSGPTGLGLLLCHWLVGESREGRVTTASSAPRCKLLKGDNLSFVLFSLFILFC